MRPVRPPRGKILSARRAARRRAALGRRGGRVVFTNG